MVVETTGATLTATGITVEHAKDADDHSDLLGLFADVAEGRHEALEGLWDRCVDQLYGLALWRTGSRSDAEDVVQEVWVRLARAGQRLRRVRNPRAYLFTMVRNAVSDLAAGRRSVPLDETESALLVTDDTDARIDGRRATELLLQLSPKLREAVFLRHLVGLNFREIAEICGVPLFTAASRHRLAIRRLRQLMGVEDES
jgi:RNA polymerase sigma-70 factor (ECF subfamily)